MDKTNRKNPSNRKIKNLLKTSQNMINPKLGEFVHNSGGNMVVSEVLFCSENVACVEIQGIYAAWLKVLCTIVRHNNELWAF